MLTNRLRLRPFHPDDLDALHAMWSHPDVGRWVGGTHTDIRESVRELEEHLDHQQRHGFGFWAVEERDTGRLVGEIGLMLFENEGPDVEIGWCIRRDAWGRGYAQEAASAWLDTAFADLQLQRVIAVVLPANTRSRRLCERLGMREAGMRWAYEADHVLYEVFAPGAEA